jgi:hypothetical protein
MIWETDRTRSSQFPRSFLPARTLDFQRLLPKATTAHDGIAIVI